MAHRNVGHSVSSLLPWLPPLARTPGGTQGTAAPALTFLKSSCSAASSVISSSWKSTGW